MYATATGWWHEKRRSGDNLVFAILLLLLGRSTQHSKSCIDMLAVVYILRLVLVAVVGRDSSDLFFYNATVQLVLQGSDRAS